MTMIEPPSIASSGDVPEPIEPILWPALWRYKWTIGAVALVAGTLAFALSSLQDDSYVARAQLLLANPASAGEIEVGGPRGNRYDTSQANLATTGSVAERAAAALATDTAEVQASISTSVLSSGQAFFIEATRPSAAEAAAYANAVAAAYQEVRLEQVTAGAAVMTEILDVGVAEAAEALRIARENSASEEELQALFNQLGRLEDQLLDVEVGASRFKSGVLNVDEAVPPTSRTSPTPWRDAVIGFGLALIVALGAAFWRQSRAPLADDHRDAAAALGVPLLAEVPVFAGDLGGLRADNPEAEGAPYGLALSALGVAIEEARPLIVVTSAHRGDGRTVTALNLAAAAVADGRRVLVVDADQEGRALTSLANADDQQGLFDLPGGAELSELVRTVDLDGTAIEILPAGTPPSHVGGFFRGRGFRDAMSAMRGAADITFFDTPALLASTDAVGVAARADAAILIVDEGTPVASLRTARERLELVGVPLAGYIFNRASRSPLAFRKSARS